MTEVQRLDSRSPHCIFAEVKTDFSHVFVHPTPSAASEYYELEPKQAGIDPGNLNLTPEPLPSTKPSSRRPQFNDIYRRLAVAILASAVTLTLPSQSFAAPDSTGSCEIGGDGGAVFCGGSFLITEPGCNSPPSRSTLQGTRPTQAPPPLPLRSQRPKRPLPGPRSGQPNHERHHCRLASQPPSSRLQTPASAPFPTDPAVLAVSSPTIPSPDRTRRSRLAMPSPGSRPTSSPTAHWRRPRINDPPPSVP